MIEYPEKYITDADSYASMLVYLSKTKLNR